MDEHEFLLTAAQAEADDETYGASNYVAHHRDMRDALTVILGVHDDPSTEDGTLVQLEPRAGRVAVVRPDDDEVADAP